MLLAVLHCTVCCAPSLRPLPGVWVTPPIWLASSPRGRMQWLTWSKNCRRRVCGLIASPQLAHAAENTSSAPLTTPPLHPLHARGPGEMAKGAGPERMRVTPDLATTDHDRCPTSTLRGDGTSGACPHDAHTGRIARRGMRCCIANRRRREPNRIPCMWYRPRTGMCVPLPGAIMTSLELSTVIGQHGFWGRSRLL